MNVLFLLGAILIFIALILKATNRIRGGAEQYGGLPTSEEYFLDHPNCKTGAGIVCRICGSKSIRNSGVESIDDHRRVMTCNQCNTGLYKI